MAKYIAEIILAGSRVLGRALGQALKEEYAASQNAAKARAGSNSNDASGGRGESNSLSALGISLDEAKQILNVSDIRDSENVLKKYEHLFGINDPKKGGTLYLQSKVFRAKERIDEELQASSSSSSGDTKASPGNGGSNSSCGT